MRFCDLAKLLYQYQKNKTNIENFVKELIDAILDDKAFENEECEPNPFYGLKDRTLQALYSGKRKIAKKNAAAIAPHIREKKFAGFIADYSKDAQAHIRDKLAEYHFTVLSHEVGKALANILAQIIWRRAEGLDDDITSLNYARRQTGQLLINIAPASIVRRGDKLQIAGETITISKALVPDDVLTDELKYIKALYCIYAEKLKMDSFTEEDVPSLPQQYAASYKEQREAYYSARGIERTIRDVFDDGENEFNALKEDAWHGINETYWKDYEDGYARLIAVLEKITNTTLERSVLCQIRGLIGNLEKKGICHILVNDGIILSWVKVDE